MGDGGVVAFSCHINVNALATHENSQGPENRQGGNAALEILLKFHQSKIEIKSKTNTKTKTTTTKYKQTNKQAT